MSIAQARARVLAAALEYAAQSSGGTDPLGAGARLRLAAKAYADAVRAVAGASPPGGPS